MSAQARLVANNMTIVHEARTTLLAEPSTESLLELQAALLPDDAKKHGLRTVQNWIGGSSYHPLDADYMPPEPGLVPELMDDLVEYLNSGAHSPVVQAGLAHAQFETIHPFIDGNGRVGRALIHTVLTRRGLATDAVLPVSLVLSTLRDDYIQGLTAFRHSGEAGSAAFHEARAAWLRVFSKAVLQASAQAAQLASDLAELRADWDRKLNEARASQGKVREVRGDSATALILRDLPGTPVLTSATVRRIHRVSKVAADRALIELVSGNILTFHERRGVRYYMAKDLLDLVTWAQRRLASTQFDTRSSPPTRPAPAAPGRLAAR